MGMYDKCPCRHCIAPKRHVGCHANCEDKKEWDQKLEATRKAINKERLYDHTAFSFLVESQQKTAKKHGKKG